MILSVLTQETADTLPYESSVAGKWFTEAALATRTDGASAL